MTAVDFVAEYPDLVLLAVLHYLMRSYGQVWSGRSPVPPNPTVAGGLPSSSRGAGWDNPRRMP